MTTFDSESTKESLARAAAIATDPESSPTRRRPAADTPPLTRAQQTENFEQACVEPARSRVVAAAEELKRLWHLGQRVGEILGLPRTFDSLEAEEQAVASYGAHTIDTIGEAVGASWEEVLFGLRLFRCSSQELLGTMIKASLAADKVLFPRSVLAELVQDPDVDGQTFPQIAAEVIRRGKPLNWKRRQPAQVEKPHPLIPPLEVACRRIDRFVKLCQQLFASHELALLAAEDICLRDHVPPPESKTALPKVQAIHAAVTAVINLLIEDQKKIATMLHLKAKRDVAPSADPAGQTSS